MKDRILFKVSVHYSFISSRPSFISERVLRSAELPSRQPPTIIGRKVREAYFVPTFHRTPGRCEVCQCAICQHGHTNTHTEHHHTVRDRSKFIGYLGRVLGKICPPFLSRKKVFAPLFFKARSAFSKWLCPSVSL